MARFDKVKARRSRHVRIRSRLSGTSNRPRLSVFRSHGHIYAQLIDDTAGHTVLAASTLVAAAKPGNNKGSKKDAAQGVGAVIGKLALEKGIEQVVFDRGGYKYHGRVKALAEAAREAGLKF